jgi:hypothetical protein
MKIRDAARQAKILKPPDALRQLCKWWTKALADQRRTFLSEINRHEREEVA